MNILIIAAHPDDEILGCGGSIARLVEEKNKVYVTILGEGITSRDKTRNTIKRKKDIIKLKQSIEKANYSLGVSDIYLFDFPDNRFDSVHFLDIVKTIEDVISIVKPKIIFTHFENDLNIDHQITYKATITASRPLPNTDILELYSFEILSSSEWNFNNNFSPNYYVNIENFIEKKLNAMSFYNSELRSFPHPRSLEGIKIKAQQRGMEVGVKFAEAFKTIRIIK